MHPGVCPDVQKSGRKRGDPMGKLQSPMSNPSLIGRSWVSTGRMAAAVALAAGIVVQAADVTLPGYLKRQYYLNGTRNNIVAGTAILDNVSLIDSGEAPTDVANNYGQRVSGLFKPATSGKYVFWIASDDDSDLYLSTDATPANKRLIAQQPSWGNAREWTTAEGGKTEGAIVTQKSSGTWSPDGGTTTPFAAGIQLNAGQSYYIEMIHREGGGGDNLGVTATTVDNLPTNDDPTTLKGSNIAAIVANPTKLGISAPPANVTVFETGLATFTATLDTDGELTPNYQWLRNGQVIAGATTPSYSLVTTMADNGAKFSVRVTTPTLAGLTSLTATSAEATLTVQQAVEVVGSLKREYYPGAASRAAVFNNTAGNPSSTTLVNSFDAPRDVANDYGQRISGFFKAPATGLYAFIVCSDDDSDLYLSTDDKPANKRLVAQQTTWANALEWTTSEGGKTDGVIVTQKSSASWSPDGGTTFPFANGISLVAGKQYYIEGVMHEGGGGDNFSATFHLISEAAPDNGTASAFTGNNISVKVPKATIAITSQPANASAVEGRATSFSVAADVTGVVSPSFQWKKNGVAIDGATSATYKTPLTVLGDNNAKFSVDVKAPGASLTSAEAVLTVIPDTFPPAIVSAGALRNAVGSVDVGVVFDEPIDETTITAGNFSLSGGSVSTVKYVANSSTYSSLERGAVLTASGLTPGSTYTLTVRNVKDIRGNAITSATAQFTVQRLTWAAIGNDSVDMPAGAIAAGNDGVNVQSGGSAFWNATDDVTFVYEQVTGDFDKVVKIEGQDASSNWARAGLMVRETLATDSRHQSVHCPDNKKFDGSDSNNAFETNRRLATGGNTSSSGSGGKPSYPDGTYVRLVRKGDVIHMFRSVDGITWTQLGRTDFLNIDGGEATPLPATMYVGMVYGPENGNIDEAKRKQWTAKFRGYGDFKPNVARGTQSYSIGINFGASENSGILSSKEVAGVPTVAQANWNNAEGNVSDAALPLVADVGGTASKTTATAEWLGSPNTWSSTGRGEENIAFIGSDRSLMTGFLDTGNSTTTQITISGLPAQLTGGKYDVVVYSIGGVAERGGAFRVVDASGNVLSGYQTILAPANPSAYKQLVAPDATTAAYANYVLFKGLSASSIIIEATTENGRGQGGTPRAPVNAVQLVSPSGLVKDPASIVVVGTPPAGFSGATLTNVVVDEKAGTITADVPAGSEQGYLTLSPARVIKSIEIVGGKIVIKF